MNSLTPRLCAFSAITSLIYGLHCIADLHAYALHAHHAQKAMQLFTAFLSHHASFLDGLLHVHCNGTVPSYIQAQLSLVSQQ